ncbi:hypothetical protein NSTC745_00174 [Nostoc sp. DSM 114161]|jgi:hypothetical protein
MAVCSIQIEGEFIEIELTLCDKRPDIDDLRTTSILGNIVVWLHRRFSGV